MDQRKKVFLIALLLNEYFFFLGVILAWDRERFGF